MQAWVDLPGSSTAQELLCLGARPIWIKALQGLEHSLVAVLPQGGDKHPCTSVQTCSVQHRYPRKYRPSPQKSPLRPAEITSPRTLGQWDGHFLTTLSESSVLG